MAERILVVDRLEAKRHVIAAYVRAGGYEAIEAATPAEALRRLDEDSPAVVIVDVAMGDPAALSFCGTVRQAASRGAPKVLVVSATRVSPGDRADAYRHDADGYLQRPLHREELLAMVGSLARAWRGDEELRLERRMVQAIFDHAPHGQIFCGMHYRCDRVNQAAARILGMAAREVEGQDLREVLGQVYAAEQAEEVFARMRHALETGAGERGAISAPRPQGTAHVEWQVRRCVAEGEVIGTVVTLAEVTREVEERQEMARSNSDLSAFAGTAAHDLQEPLRMVSSYLALLQRRFPEVLDPVAREYVEFAADGARRMSAMIASYLAYARIGQEDRSFALVDLRGVVDEARANLDSAVAETRAELAVGELPSLWGDRALLVQLFQNLIGNALKYRGEAAPRVRVDAESAGSDWLVAVRDNGIGIAEGDLQRIFHAFTRVGQTQVEGLGIGLASCRKIVEIHNGRIWVESTPGHGSTFRMRFPKLKSDAEAARGHGVEARG